MTELRAATGARLLSLLQAVERRAQEAHLTSTRAAAGRWRSFAQAALDEAGKDAYSLAKGPQRPPAPTLLDGLPVAACFALEANLRLWLGLWWNPSRAEERAQAQRVLDAAAAAHPIEPLTVADLERVLATYPQRLGLGADSIQPRALLYLPDEYRARFLDVLHSWEGQRSPPKGWAHMMVLVPKPEGGGNRTIGLSASPMRVWSRLRVATAASWERGIACDAFFWGPRAAHVRLQPGRMGSSKRPPSGQG